jgi:hypothetical protein
VPQLASPVAAAPFARLEVAPDDFPFLAAIRGHEDDRLGEIAEAVMTAAPWPGVGRVERLPGGRQRSGEDQVQVAELVPEVAVLEGGTVGTVEEHAAGGGLE